MPAMNENTGYPIDRLARAFVTALIHEDAETRHRAEELFGRWRPVLEGMADGTLTVGSRAPVAGLPVWATPQVVRGGVATGTAQAGGPPLPFEIAAAERAGVPAERRAIFLHHLTDTGLAELDALLDNGAYEIAVPEEAALLTVAYLLRAGDQTAALALIDELEPYADRLRFTPRPGRTPPPPPPPPQNMAATTTGAYADDTLCSLMAANDRAFRDRRSALPPGLERHVPVEELPWVRAVAGHRRNGTGAGSGSGSGSGSENDTGTRR